ncbi:hypothetical protein [Hymenobacter rigui]|uniref:hypothetical protein n=1 Tax=Hymenobacter rigui TaxID=334424 RepID=UPI0014769349|nr:hypothetical protein [Hymenobacter rigui]
MALQQDALAHVQLVQPGRFGGGHAASPTRPGLAPAASAWVAVGSGGSATLPL